MRLQYWFNPWNRLQVLSITINQYSPEETVKPRAVQLALLPSIHLFWRLENVTFYFICFLPLPDPSSARDPFTSAMP